MIAAYTNTIKIFDCSNKYNLVNEQKMINHNIKEISSIDYN